MNTPERPLRLRDVVRDVIRTGRYSPRTKTTYSYWIRCFMRFHSMSHPRELGETDVQALLTWLAVERGGRRFDREPCVERFGFPVWEGSG